MTGPEPSDDERPTYRAMVGSQALDLPIVPLSDDLAIALLITVDLGVGFAAVAGRELAAELAPFGPEVVVSVATMGIPLAIEVTRALGLDDYVILHKTPKIHLADAYTEPVRSITTGAPQTLRLDPARVGAVRGRRVAIVDDVISTGASTQAALALVRRVGGDPVARSASSSPRARIGGACSVTTPSGCARSVHCRCSGGRRTGAGHWGGLASRPTAARRQLAGLTVLMLKSGMRSGGMAVRFTYSPPSRLRARTVAPTSVARASRSTGLSLNRKLVVAPTTLPSSTT